VIDQLDGDAAPREPASVAALVLPDPPLQVSGDASIKQIAFAPEDINEPGLIVLFHLFQFFCGDRCLKNSIKTGKTEIKTMVKIATVK
jgi:hypothetical protein